MSREFLSCPGCSARLARPVNLEHETTTRCPRCDHVFVPMLASAPPEAETRVATGPIPNTVRWSVPSDATAPSAPSFGPQWVGYLELWFNTAGTQWHAIRTSALPYLLIVGLFGVPAYHFVTYYPLALGLNPDWLTIEESLIHGAVAEYLLQPGLFWLYRVAWFGLLAVAIRHLRGQPWTFSTFFLGLHYAGSLLLFSLFHYLMVFLRLTPVYLPWWLWLLGWESPEDWMTVESVEYRVILAAGLIVEFYFLVRWFFVLPLMADQNMGLLQAMATSWKMTRGHVIFLAFAWGIVVSLFYISLLCALVGGLLGASYVALMVATGYLEAVHPRSLDEQSDE